MPPPPGAEFAPPDWEPDPALLAAIEKDDPEFWKDVTRFRSSEPQRYRDEVFRWKNRRDRLARLRTEDPEKARLVERIDALERQSRKLADQIRGAPEAEQGALKDSLHSVLADLFDRREEDRRDEIARLERRLTDLKAGIEDRRARKEQIVRRRMTELLEDEESLRW